MDAFPVIEYQDKSGKFWQLSLDPHEFPGLGAAEIAMLLKNGALESLPLGTWADWEEAKVVCDAADGAVADKHAR